MQRYEVEESQRASWNDYPVRIKGMRECGDCGSPMLLVRWSQGGFVKEICSACRNDTTLSDGDFVAIGRELYVECPKCRKEMSVDTEGRDHGNYAFLCEPCELLLLLADLIPNWNQSP